MATTAEPTTVPVSPRPDVLYKASAVAGYDDVTYEVKEDLFRQVKADMRFPDYLYGCYDCGICVAVCPSARFYDFSPRRIAQAAGREDVELFYQQMQEDIWECSQCFSCLRCPRGNNPGGVILIMREVAINNGLASARQALEGYSRIVFKIMSTGTQVSPDMLQPDAFPDWGPEVKDVSDNLDLWRRALPPETHHTTSASWEVDEKTLVELYLIWFHTGVLDMIKEVDESLYMILSEVMEDRLEEAGVELRRGSGNHPEIDHNGPYQSERWKAHRCGSGQVSLQLCDESMGRLTRRT